MESIELKKEYDALFERWKRERDKDIFASFYEIETAHPGSFLSWFQAILLLKEAYRHTDYIFLFNAVIPQCIEPDIITLLDCTELMIERTKNDLVTSEAHKGLVEYCLLSMDTLERVLQVLSSGLERWKLSFSIILQTCYTHDSELIPQFIQDALKTDSTTVQYTLAMSISLLDISESSEENKGYFGQILEVYRTQFPSLPLDSMKAAYFCVIMHLSSQLSDVPSDLLLTSFSSELFLMSEVPMEFSSSVLQYYFKMLQSKGELTPQDWEIVSHLLRTSPCSDRNLYFLMDSLMEQLYKQDSIKALSVFFILVKRNPMVSIKDFYGLFTEMEKGKALIDFSIALLLYGGELAIENNKESITEALSAPIDEISNVLVGKDDHTIAFLARKGIFTLWFHPSILCPFLLALLIQSAGKQTRSMITEYLKRWVVIPYPRAFRAYKEKLMQDTSASDKQIQHISTLYEYSLEFEAAMEEIPRLKEIQPSLQQRYHKSVYDVEQQEAIGKRSKELSVIRQFATEIPILFANSTLDLQNPKLDPASTPVINDMHLFEFSRETSRTMVWDYPTFEIELSLFASEERV